MNEGVISSISSTLVCGEYEIEERRCCVPVRGPSTLYNMRGWSQGTREELKSAGAILCDTSLEILGTSSPDGFLNSASPAAHAALN